MTETVMPKSTAVYLKTSRGTADEYFHPNDLTEQQLQYFGERIGLFEKGNSGQAILNFEHVRQQYAILYFHRTKPEVQNELNRIHAKFISFKLKASQI